jgi:hypothetical protein
LIQNKFSRDWCLTNRVQEYRLIMNWLSVHFFRYHWNSEQTLTCLEITLLLVKLPGTQAEESDTAWATYKRHGTNDYSQYFKPYHR